MKYFLNHLLVIWPPRSGHHHKWEGNLFYAITTPGIDGEELLEGMTTEFKADTYTFSH